MAESSRALSAGNPMSPALVIGPFADAIEASIEKAELEIVHMKALVECSEGLIKVAVSGRGGRKSVEGGLQPLQQMNTRYA